jgi:hypothetical protein
LTDAAFFVGVNPPFFIEPYCYFDFPILIDQFVIGDMPDLNPVFIDRGIPFDAGRSLESDLNGIIVAETNHRLFAEEDRQENEADQSRENHHADPKFFALSIHDQLIGKEKA